MTVQCCKCKRVRDGDAWVGPEHAAEGPISHTYCSRCYTESCLEFFSEEASCARYKAAQLVSELIQNTVSAV